MDSIIVNAGQKCKAESILVRLSFTEVSFLLFSCMVGLSAEMVKKYQKPQTKVKKKKN